MSSFSVPVASAARPRPSLVVVAEDDDEMRSLVSRALRRDGHEVVATSDGASLLTALVSLMDHGAEPDLVISDVRMPRGGGLEVVEAARNAGWRTRFVLVSGFADADVRDRAAALGVAHVLSKPFDLDDLRTVALHVLRRSGA